MIQKEPSRKRAVCFFDGQNLFHAAKAAFGHSWPDYDIVKLAETMCQRMGWDLVQTRFYTGLPDAEDNPGWNQFWMAKLRFLSWQGVHIFSRSLRYRNKSFRLQDGSEHTVVMGEEKGIDVRIAIDIIHMAHHGDFDVALVFSQDQDLSEVASEIRVIAGEQGRWIKMACAFPSSPTHGNQRGINGTDWIRISRAEYEACLDPHDYRTGMR